MKDFTKAQAASWVRQEAAKHTTPESRAERIAYEIKTADMMRSMHGRFPNSDAAHEALVAVLRAAITKKEG